MPIKVAAKTVRLKVYMTIASPTTLPFVKGHKCVSNLTGFFYLQYLGQYYIQTWHGGTLMDVIYSYVHFNDLDLDARSQWVGNGKILALNALCN